MGIYLWLWIDKGLFNKTEALNIKEKISKLDYFKIKKYCSSKDIIRRLHEQTEGEKIFAMHVSYKEPVY